MSAGADYFRAHLAARDLSQDLLLAYAEETYRTTMTPSDIRLEEVSRLFRELAGRLGFTIEQKKLEAAE